MSSTKTAEISPKAIFMRLWHGWVKKYRGMILLNFVLIFIFAGTNSLYPLAISYLVDNIGKNPTVLYWIMAAALGVAFLKAGALLGHRWLNNRIFANVVTDLQRDVYDHMVEADMHWHGKEPAAQRSTRITSDVMSIRTGMERVVNSLLRDSLTVVGLVAAMIYIDWQLCLVAFAVFPIAALPIVSLGKVLRKLGRQTQAEVGLVNAELQESLSSVRIAKTFQLEPRLKQRGAAKFMRLRWLMIRAADHKALLDPILEVLAGVAIVGVLIFVGWRIDSGANSLGDFAGFIFAMLAAAQPLRAIGNLSLHVQNTVGAAERVFGVLDEKAEVIDTPGAQPCPYSRATLSFENVNFSYSGEEDAQALEGLSIEVEEGATVALVGRSGAGKSTIFNLIPRLYDPSGGRILLNGQDIREMTIESLRAGIAVVTQEAILFNDTVATNIALGRFGGAEPSQAEIEAAARAAGAHEFIMALPEGYETIIGDRGDRLSGGQRQRLSIARAFLRDAPILLLDEATSALDAEAEALIKDALARLTEGRTTIAIAHRLSTIMDADKIIVLDQGRLAEQGDHAELLARDGVYASLFRLQFQKVIEKSGG